MFIFFFFKQKTAYEMRISDWSSDVCSSDLIENGRTHDWAYASYEGRTTIAAEAARAGGVKSERAGPVSVAELVDMAGRIEITPEGKADVRARLPGQIVWMTGPLGQAVRKGQAVLRVESSHALPTYYVSGPNSGNIIEKNHNVGTLPG